MSLPVSTGVDWPVGKKFLVTGASSGVGRAVALALARAGASVILSGRDKDRLDATLASMVGSGHDIMPCDLAQAEAVEPWIRCVLEKHGPMDGMAYCAGVANRQRLRDMTTRLLHSVMQVNFFAFVECVRLLARLKPKAYPMRIVAMSSLASNTYEKYFTAYSASKSALEASVRSLASELMPRQVGICTLRAAFIDTPMARGVEGWTGNFDAFLRSGYQPMGLIPAENVADMVVFLLSDKARYINGAQVPFNACSAC